MASAPRGAARRAVTGAATAAGTSALVLLDCVECGDQRAFECPPCADGHADCPDLACIDCGSAVVVGLPDPAPVATPFRTRASSPPPSDETVSPWSTLPRTA
ncbi:hypothetical protein [Motilibacter aurantiacus]|uniref:hypothetical protein n=1 Tax=Motilibacter aurantiacus TaxID=2714955 RepID=UPI001407E795|nr:hypothetical protein [Motilibacter aurantiacus]NHC46128.1 hypothetical protein [Motilibacter aurantiacus]